MISDLQKSCKRFIHIYIEKEKNWNKDSWFPWFTQIPNMSTFYYIGFILSCMFTFLYILYTHIHTYIYMHTESEAFRGKRTSYLQATLKTTQRKKLYTVTHQLKMGTCSEKCVTTQLHQMNTAMMSLCKIILWDHHHICSLLLAKISLLGIKLFFK